MGVSSVLGECTKRYRTEKDTPFILTTLELKLSEAPSAEGACEDADWLNEKSED